MSILSIAIHQVQLRPQYHPSYSTDQRSDSLGRCSKLRRERKNKLHSISLEIGEAIHAEIFAVIRKTDPKIHKDDCRKMLEELCDEKRMDRRVSYGGGKRIYYKARPA